MARPADTCRPGRYCQHGNRIGDYLCPDCDAERMRKRQVKVDRARFQERLRRVKGEPFAEKGGTSP